MRDRFFASVVVVLLIACARTGSAQTCQHGWASGPLFPDLRGANGPVHVLLTYDPPGPQPPMLFVGGEFTRIGNIAANNIAAWDGTVWRPLGDGTTGPVRSLIRFGDNLIVGGEFDEAGTLGISSRLIAGWNGANWLYVGNGLGSLNVTGRISKMVVYDGQLVVSGKVFGQGDMFRWTGSFWEDVTHPEANNEPRIFEAFDADGPGPLIQHIISDCHHTVPVLLSRWNGTTWDDFVPAPTHFRDASTITNDGLVVVGSLQSIYLGDFEWDQSIRGVAVWDGKSWSGYGTGVIADYQEDERITSVRQWGNDLYIAGHFDNAGGTAVQNMARWNGSQWFSTGFLFTGEGYRDVNDMRVHNNELIVGGDFNVEATGGMLNNLAKFNGSAWSPLLAPSTIHALGTIGSSLVMGGDFGYVDGKSETYDPYYIALWNGQTVSTLNGGVNGPVHALVSYTSNGGVFNHLIAGGAFTEVGSQGGQGGVAGSAPASRVASWSNMPLTGGWQPMGNGFNNTVLALERVVANTVLEESIIAGGLFTANASGGTTFNRIAAWNHSLAAWAPLGTGFNGAVRAVKAYNVNQFSRNIIAAGDFTTASGGAANRVAIFEAPNQNGWQPMGSGFNDSVYALERHGGSIYAGGAFTASGATAINHVARWNGSAWENVGTGLNGNVYALKSINGTLYACCEVTVGGGRTVSMWNGSTWVSVDGGVTFGAARTILPFNTELVVGGNFTAAQSGEVETSGIARHRLVGLPWIIQQPQSQVVSCRTDVRIEAVIPPGYDDLEFQWYVDGEPIELGHTGFGSYLELNGSALVIYNATEFDEGSYHVVMSNPCGELISSAGTLDVIGPCPPCPADIVTSATLLPPPDGWVSGADLAVLLGMWGRNPDAYADFVTSATLQPPPDGIVDGADLAFLIGAWGFCD